jgi:hypothetical protein
MNPLGVTLDSADILAPYRVGPPWLIGAPELPLLCGVCGRRLCDITMAHGTTRLIRVSMTEGIPRTVQPGRGAQLSGAPRGQTPRHARVKVYVSEANARWRVWHEHKGRGRGPLDRTVTPATLEKLYAAALTAGNGEVVLR